MQCDLRMSNFLYASFDCIVYKEAECGIKNNIFLECFVAEGILSLAVRVLVPPSVLDQMKVYRKSRTPPRLRRTAPLKIRWSRVSQSPSYHSHLPVSQVVSSFSHPKVLTGNTICDFSHIQ